MLLEEYPITISDNDKTVQCYYQYHDEKKLLAEFNRETHNTTIYPLVTIIASTDFLKPKYAINFKFEGYDVDIEERETPERLFLLSGLPEVFIKALKYGLGLKKEYKFITEISKHVDGCEYIIISDIRETCIDGKNIIISDSDLDKIRRGMDRTDDFYKSESLLSRRLFVYNEILHAIDPEKFPEMKKPSKKDVIYRFIKDIDFSKNVSDVNKESLLEIKNNIDLDYFATVKTKFDGLIENKHKEADFQKFFEKNPLLLTLFAGSPYVLFNNQAYLGGKSFDNRNSQYTDFLYKNKLTNNSFIIEIKRPDTSLLKTKSYRTGVYQPSKDLSGAVSQVLTQKYQLDSDIASLIKNSSNRDVDAYNAQCLLIVGLLKELDGENAKEKKRSFELYRNNQKNIRIITYDECQELLNIFIDGLKRETNP
jgi:hypothetical protein